MADYNMSRSQRAYNCVVETLDSHGLDHSDYPKDSEIYIGSVGEEIQSNVKIMLYKDIELMMMVSSIPFIVPQEKRVDIAAAINMINCTLRNGSFDFNFLNGNIIFRVTGSYIESEMDPDMVRYMLDYSLRKIEEYYNRLFMLCFKNLTLSDFIRTI